MPSTHIFEQEVKRDDECEMQETNDSPIKIQKSLFAEQMKSQTRSSLDAKNQYLLINLDDTEERKGPLQLQSILTSDPLHTEKVSDLTSEDNKTADEEIKSDTGIFKSESLISTLSSSMTDPLQALCHIREEYIFTFSGFNDKKLLHCEVFDV